MNNAYIADLNDKFLIGYFVVSKVFPHSKRSILIGINGDQHKLKYPIKNILSYNIIV